MDQPYVIKGWEAMRKYAGVSLSTLKRKHYHGERIPLRKLKSSNPQSDVVVKRAEFEAWIDRNLLVHALCSAL